MSKILFMSHSNKDFDQAKILRDQLENRGYSCWIAEKDEVAGDKWDEKIIQAINNCKLALILVSQHSSNSDHVKKELHMVNARKKKIIPVIIDEKTEILGCKLEFVLADTHYVEARQGLAHENVLNEIITHLEIQLNQSLEENTSAIGSTVSLGSKIHDKEAQIDEHRIDLLKQKGHLEFVIKQQGFGADQMRHSIEEHQNEINQLIIERNELYRQYKPRAFFRIRRTISTGLVAYPQERPITIRVEISNKGDSSAVIEYEDMTPPQFKIIEGSQVFTADIPSAETVYFSYSGYFTIPGKYLITCKNISYPEKVEGRDDIINNIIEIGEATPALVDYQRKYRYTTDGIEIMSIIENTGDRIVCNCSVEDLFFLNHNLHPYLLRHNSVMLYGGEKKIVSTTIAHKDIEDVHWQENVQITFYDTSHHQYAIELKNLPCLRFEFDFSSIPLIGREDELRVLNSNIDSVRNASTAGGSPIAKKVIIIEGTTGIGKTRLINEVVRIAISKKMGTVIEDARQEMSSISIVKRLMISALDLDPTNIDETQLKKALEKRSINSPHILKFLFPDDQDDISSSDCALSSHLFTGFYQKVFRKPTVVIIENAHWIQQGPGTEYLCQFIQAVIHRSSQIPVLVIITSRKNDPGNSHVFLQNLRLTNERSQTLTLREITEKHTEGLVNSLITYPRFSLQLHRYIWKSSKGNPLFIVELLKLLTSPYSEYLKRADNEWELEHKPEGIPEDLKKIILERMKLPEELGTTYQQCEERLTVLRALSSIGMKLYPDFLKQLEHCILSPLKQTIDEHLKALVPFGMLSFNIHTNIYEFDHWIKLQAIIDDPDMDPGFIFKCHETITEFLLKSNIASANNKISGDSLQELLGYHLLRCSSGFQKTHLESLKQIAVYEHQCRNFSRTFELLTKCFELTSEDAVLERVRILIDISHNYSITGDLEKAESYLCKANDLCNTSSSSLHVPLKQTRETRFMNQRILREKISIRLQHDDMQEADLLMKEFQTKSAVRMFQKQDEESIIAECETHIEWAEYFLNKKKLRKCEEQLKLAEKISKNTTSKRLIADMLVLQSRLLLQLNITNRDLDLSKKPLNILYEAEKIAKSIEDKFIQDRICLIRAEIFRTIGDYSKATESYLNAIEIQEQLGDNRGLYFTYIGLADIYLKNRATDKALAAYIKVHNLHVTSGIEGPNLQVYLNLIDLHIKNKKLAEADNFWLEIRPLLIIEKLNSLDLDNLSTPIRCALQEIADYYCKLNDWEKVRERLQDREWLRVPEKLESEEKETIANELLALSNAQIRTQHWNEAVKTLYDASELAQSPGLSSTIYELLGDAYCQSEAPERDIYSQVQWQEDVKDQAERAYEEAVKILFREKKQTQALVVYEKLLQRLLCDEAGILQLPFTFLRIFESINTKCIDYTQLVLKSAEFLNARKCHREAGDIYVFEARILIGLGHLQSDKQIILDALSAAEGQYRMCERISDLLFGLSNLIPVFGRINEWNRVKVALREVFDLSLKNKNSREFISSLHSLWVFQNNLEEEELKHIVDSLDQSLLTLDPKELQRSHLNMLIGKMYYTYAKRITIDQPFKDYRNLAFNIFEEMLKNPHTTDSDKSTLFNDSAIILIEQGDYVNALQRLNESILISERCGDNITSARTKINRADILAKKDDPKKVIEDYQQGINTLEAERIKCWRARFEHSDHFGITADEMSEMVYDVNYVSHAHNKFANYLEGIGYSELANKHNECAKQLCIDFGTDQFKMDNISTLFAELIRRYGAGADKKNTDTIETDDYEDTFYTDKICSICKSYIPSESSRCPTCHTFVCRRCGTAMEESTDKCPNPECEEEYYIVCPIPTCLGPVDRTTLVCRKCHNPVSYIAP